MAKDVLISAGPVYAPLDRNKIVSNRCRGIWAVNFAHHLLAEGFNVHVLLPKLMQNVDHDLDIRYHDGYEEYAKACRDAAPHCDAMLLAAAVVNWIPKTPFPGKMPTEGLTEINVPFVLAPRVIDEMRQINPKLTLIGCKLTAGSPHEETIAAAQHVALRARCAAVVANDIDNLREKWVVHSDGAVIPFIGTKDTMSTCMLNMYQYLTSLIRDKHFSTKATNKAPPAEESIELFSRIIEKHRDSFISADDHSFGALMIVERATTHSMGGYLCTPRHKGPGFDSRSYVHIAALSRCDMSIYTTGGKKASLNAPLLCRVIDFSPRVERGEAVGAIHLHRQLPGVRTVLYYPPGTERDTLRREPPPFNIEGHGCIALVDNQGNILA